MKKTLVYSILTILICSVLLFTSCSINSNNSVESNELMINSNLDESNTESININDGTDKTIKVDAINVEGSTVLGDIVSQPEFSRIYANAEQLSEQATDIVRGEIVDIEYFTYKAHGKSLLTIRVDEVYDGNLDVGDKISVIEHSGYVPIKDMIDYYGPKYGQELSQEEIETGIFVDKFYGAPLSKVGEKVYLFLIYEDEEDDEFKGAYYIVGGFMGKYTETPDGNLERYEPDKRFYTLADPEAKRSDMVSPSKEQLEKDINKSLSAIEK